MDYEFFVTKPNKTLDEHDDSRDTIFCTEYLALNPTLCGAVSIPKGRFTVLHVSRTQVAPLQI